MITPEQHELIGRIAGRIEAAANAVVEEHAAELQMARIDEIKMHLELEVRMHGEAEAAPQTDAEFLRSLRIAPRLEAGDGS